MAEPPSIAFRLLNLLALLFPVVALTLQLQHRAADSAELERRGLVAGMGLLSLLSISFLLVSSHLLFSQSLPWLLSLALASTAAITLQIPFLVLFSSDTFVEALKSTFPVVSKKTIASKITVILDSVSDDDPSESDEYEEQK